VLADHGGNWIRSSMSTLAGQFAGILHAELPEARLADCLEAYAALGDEGLTVITHAGPPPLELPDQRTLEMELVGNDAPGIVRDITAVLAALRVSVEELETGVESASMAGGNLFRARALLQVPDDVTRDQLRGAVEDIAQDLMVEFHADEADR
jgi:glycine cleavage system regulatory protein